MLCAFFVKFMQKFVLYIIKNFPVCFALRFLANLSNNLSFVTYRKFPIAYVLRYVFWLT